MGRQINRVPIGFDWPIGQTWMSYAVRVKFPPCPDCSTVFAPCGACGRAPDPHGTGDSPTASRIKAELRSGLRPFPAGVGGWDTYGALQQIVTAEGFDPFCPRCQGHGDLATDEMREWAESMPSSPIPTGDGWQLWETVGDSPMSPVFATSGELVEWMTANPWMLNPSLTGPSLVTSSRDVAERFVAAGSSVGLFVVRNGHLVDGVTAAIE